MLIIKPPLGDWPGIGGRACGKIEDSREARGGVHQAPSVLIIGSREAQVGGSMNQKRFESAGAKDKIGECDCAPIQISSATTPATLGAENDVPVP